MKAELVRIEDLTGSHWRLALDASGNQPLVNLECLHSQVVDGWVHIALVSSEPKIVGVDWRSAGVVMVDTKIARRILVERMAEYGAQPRPADLEAGASSMGTLPGIAAPAIAEPDMVGHVRVNLLEYMADVERYAALATSGVWRAADGTGRSLGAILDAIVTGGPMDPVAESMTTADLAHVLRTQPLAAGAMVRKLREAFYLLQDLAKAVLSMRGELDHLSSPKHRTEQYRARIDMFDRWLVAIQERCAAFPVIQVPDLTHEAPLVWQAPRANALSRDELIRLARMEAFRSGYAAKHSGTEAHAYLPTSTEEAESFAPHDWVIWAMNAAIAAAAEKP